MRKRAQFKQIPGSICAPLGFRTAAVFCDIKRLGTGKGSEKGRKDDLALIVSDVPAAVAGMFTTNQIRAAPVRVSAKHAAKNFGRAIVVNSGNANACTGAQGLHDAEKLCALAAEAVAAVYDRRARNAVRAEDSALIERRYRRIASHDVLVCSTGRIGLAMPMENVARGIRQCAPLLARSSENAQATAAAIMTSDTRRKEIAVEFQIGKSRVRIGGICKGAGMIEPKMSPHATMLVFITTDIAISPVVLKRALKVAVEQSFNRISVDGDMSTNDSVIALANGLAGNSPIGRARLSRAGKQKGWLDGVSPYHQFQVALNHVTLELAKMIVRDGEGVSRFITLRVNGAKSARDAEAVARAIANSALVKTSWCGGDPNWGRILCAIGYADAKVDETKIDIGYSRSVQSKIVFGFQRGKPTEISFIELAAITSQPEFDVHVNLRAGKHATIFYTCDLTEDYVAFNKGDVNDPTTLGG